jgi:hypothetical protein
MKSLWNDNRFLPSIKPWFWGNPQPGKVFQKRMVASLWNSRNHAQRRIETRKYTFLKSWP